MLSDEINWVLGKFWGSYIEKIDFDIRQHQIIMNLAVFHDNETPNKHQIVFDGVSSFFFANGVGEDRYRTDLWENAELTGIQFFNPAKDHITHIHEKEDVATYNASPNIILEIWSSIFLIEAKKFFIDTEEINLINK